MAECRKHFSVLAILFALNFVLEVGNASLRLKSEADVNHVHMNQNLEGNIHSAVHKRSLRHHSIVKRDAIDSRCQEQEKTLVERRKKEKDFLIVKKLGNETKYNIALTWVGENKGSLLMVTTEEMMVLALPSTVYQSKDDGSTFTNINSRINNAQIARKNGLQKDPNNPSKVYLIAYAKDSDMGARTDLWITEDGGDSFKQVKLTFTIDENIYFYPDKSHPNLLMVQQDKNLYLSKDGGYKWDLIKTNAGRFRWGTGNFENETTIYVTAMNGNEENDNQLMKSCDLGASWTTVLDHVFTFGSQGKFLYATVLVPQSKDKRIMQVSTDEGTRWNEVQLPSITQDRFYSILDMSEGMIFMHVDSPDDTGHGTLYTSDSSGIIYSESLKRHLFPNHLDVTDFYKVRSMRGVYIASQIDEDQSIHSMISFDRGAIWQRIRRPEGVMCKDESKPCFLQIHSTYSKARGIPGHPPISIENAVGLIVVHGHVADALQNTPPDVFVSSDGGYNWVKSLDGPHKIQIADHGGLLVAVPDIPNAKVIKFSTDEGRCWHSFNFTEEDLMITGLLTEPGNRAMSVAIWGFGQADRVWRTHILNFSKIITKKCDESDYTNWIAHGDNTNDPKFKGCLLGKKESYRRLNRDSLCSNTYDFEVVKNTEICKCRTDDYLCAYGYRRVKDAKGLPTCEEDPAFNGKALDICMFGYEEEITQGYRKVPGDKCQGGYVPAGMKLINLHEKCNQRSKELLMIEMGKKSHHPGPSSAIWVSVVLLVFLIALVSVVYFVRKYNLLHKSSTAYAYSTLSQNEEGMEEALLTNALYDESTEEASNLPESASRGPSYSTISHSSDSSTPAATDSVAAPSPKEYHVQPHLKKYHDDSDVDMLE